MIFFLSCGRKHAKTIPQFQAKLFVDVGTFKFGDVKLFPVLTPWCCPPKLQTPWRDLCHLLLTMKCSIWLTVVPSGDLNVSLRMLLCGKIVPPMTQLLFNQKPTRRSPLSLISPQPCFPMALSQLVLSAPTFAFMSPMIMSISCWDTWDTASCSCSYQVSLSSSSASLVGA